eukprot:CAMPEP_0201883166 /NCGR_PEP_ID=MMETSP0902-20130614/15187_1 /ASSEMBLY_ACC=CAM_ASM_000551 /TAXON_ID=420261 /ORGANISM="Thalassiosira antarctica, Strain CCMP982" /LENGTH=70 /DNA_ID=CAMNT_0048411889 /DNA_START=1 /DNA_END=216 /DNA_ORIENTATION=-
MTVRWVQAAMRGYAGLDGAMKEPAAGGVGRGGRCGATMASRKFGRGAKTEMWAEFGSVGEKVGGGIKGRW